jgi:Sulfotransferase family
MSEQPQPQLPIFILGLTRRTGTNYLWDLLARHPATVVREPIYEDFLLHHADHLVAYVDAVAAEWSAETPVEESRCLLRHLGRGLASFLGAERAGEGKRVLTKSPTIRNLPLIFTLFPGAAPLVLVRDGRSVVESAVRSFEVSYAEAAQNWALAARTLLEFMAIGEPERYLIVRYENLLTDLEAELQRIMEFCGLDPRAYDFEAAQRTPLRGSSTDRGTGVELHWRPVPRPDYFQGLARWEGWDEERHRQFNAVAGKELVRLGYGIEFGDDPS